MDFTMIGPEEGQTELLLENLLQTHRTWLKKLMIFIYDLFFQDPTEDHTYRYKADTGLLSSVIYLTLIILILFGLKLHDYLECRRCIQAQIQEVNAKWKMMTVSINILRKMIALHETIVMNQEIERLRLRESDNNREHDRQRNQCQHQHMKTLHKENETKLVHTLNKNREISHLDVNGEDICDEVVEQVSRKSKTRYTVLSAKSRSQPNLKILSGIGENDIGATPPGTKSSSSDTALTDRQGMLRKSSSTIDEFYYRSSRFEDLDEESNKTSTNEAWFTARADGDIRACNNQIVDFLKGLEMARVSRIRIPVATHLELTGLMNDLLARRSDQINSLKEELSRF